MTDSLSAPVDLSENPVSGREILEAGREAMDSPSGASERLETFIYFVRPEDRPFIKIGIAAHGPESRLRNLQTGCPDELWVEAFLRCGPCNRSEAVAIEQSVHRRFHNLRIRGEWFRRREALIAFMGQAMSHNAPYCKRCGRRPVTEKKAYGICPLCQPGYEAEVARIHEERLERERRIEDLRVVRAAAPRPRPTWYEKRPESLWIHLTGDARPRHALLLREAGFEPSEIADLMNISRGQVSSCCHRAWKLKLWAAASS